MYADPGTGVKDQSTRMAKIPKTIRVRSSARSGVETQSGYTEGIVRGVICHSGDKATQGHFELFVNSGGKLTRSTNSEIQPCGDHIDKEFYPRILVVELRQFEPGKGRPAKTKPAQLGNKRSEDVGRKDLPPSPTTTTPQNNGPAHPQEPTPDGRAKTGEPGDALNPIHIESEKPNSFINPEYGKAKTKAKPTSDTNGENSLPRKNRALQTRVPLESQNHTLKHQKRTTNRT